MLRNFIPHVDIFNNYEVMLNFDLKEFVFMYIGILNGVSERNLKSCFLEFFIEYFSQILLINMGHFFDYFEDFVSALLKELDNSSCDIGYLELIFKTIGALNVKCEEERNYRASEINRLIEQLIKFPSCEDLLLSSREQVDEECQEIIEDLLCEIGRDFN